MTPKFNFLAPRTARLKAETALRRQFPKRSPAWIEGAASRIAGNDEVSAELRAPERESMPHSQRRKHG